MPVFMKKHFRNLRRMYFVAHDLPMLPAACKAAKRCGAKLVYDSHELYGEQELSGWEKRRWNEIEAKYIKNCDCVIAINPSIAEEFKRRYGVNNVDVIYNAEQTVSIPDNRKLFHKIFHLPETSKILLYQGGLSANRHIETLVESIRYVQNLALHLVILGDGPLRRKLDKIVARHESGKTRALPFRMPSRGIGFCITRVRPMPVSSPIRPHA